MRNKKQCSTAFVAMSANFKFNQTEKIRRERETETTRKRASKKRNILSRVPPLRDQIIYLRSKDEQENRKQK